MKKRALVIGAGFYGLMIGELLCKLGFSVTILESSPSLGSGASWANQARVHGGYHYPRSFLTASRSRQSLSRFVEDFHSAVRTDFEMQYAIAREFSKVSAGQFESFCERIGAPLTRLLDPSRRKIWNENRVEAAYKVQEPAFDGLQLVEIARSRFEAAGGVLNLGLQVKSVREIRDGFIIDTSLESHQAELVFDVTYSSLGTLFEPAHSLARQLKIEHAEIALLRPPESLSKTGVTVMDGPFFSFMPFPAAGLHSLTHVTYTPRRTWFGHKPEGIQVADSVWRLMVADASRFLPELKEAEYVKSMFIEKAVLARSESTDSRPIFVHKSGAKGLYFSVLGAKIDNVYDALEVIQQDNEVRKLAA